MKIHRKLAISSALAIAGVVLSSGAALGTDSASKVVPSGSYNTSTKGFSCTEVVYNNGNGGTLSLRTDASERRQEDKHFRTSWITTRVVAQELNYYGVWKNVKYGAWHGFSTDGLATVDDGAYNIMPILDDYRLKMRVWGQDDLFRLKQVTNFYDDEGNRIAHLVNHEGSCRV